MIDVDESSFVAIIVLNWNGLNETLKCLESVFNLDYSNYEVIVIDNASDGNDTEIISHTYPQVTLLKAEGNLGYTGGNNLGICYALERGVQYFWLLNNDAIVDPNTLSALISLSETSPEIGLASPLICSQSQPDQVLYYGTYVDLYNQTKRNADNLTVIQYWQEQDSEKVCLWGTALLVKRSLVNDIGYLDDKFFAYYEDMDFSVRSIKAGYRNVVAITARIYHEPKAKYLMHYPLYYHFYMIRNEYFFWMKHLVGWPRICFLKTYWLKVIQKATHYFAIGKGNVASVYLDAAWSAIWGIGGDWHNRKFMPSILKMLLSRYPQ